VRIAAAGSAGGGALFYAVSGWSDPPNPFQVQSVLLAVVLGAIALALKSYADREPGDTDSNRQTRRHGVHRQSQRLTEPRISTRPRPNDRSAPPAAQKKISCVLLGLQEAGDDHQLKIC